MRGRRVLGFGSFKKKGRKAKEKRHVQKNKIKRREIFLGRVFGEKKSKGKESGEVT